MADADAIRDAGRAVPATTPPDSDPSASPPAPASTPGVEMTLVDHLTELRNRLVKIVIAVAVGSAVGFYFWVDIRNILLNPIPGGTVQILGPGDAFAIALRISVITGIILA